MPFEHALPYIPPATGAGVSGTERPHIGSIMAGHVGGRLSEYAKQRGLLPFGSHVTSRGVVDSYTPYGSTEYSDKLLPYIVAKSTGWDGETAAYFGLLYEYAHGPHVYDRWWPNSDPWLGVIIHMVSGTSKGQWNIIMGRPYRNDRVFRLLFDFATAPVEGDKFILGQLFYVVFGQEANAPTADTVKLLKYKPPVFHWRVGTPEARLEWYRSGLRTDVANPAYPYAGDTYAELDLGNLSNLGSKTGQPKTATGIGVGGREFSAAIVVPIDGVTDFTLDEYAYLIEQEGIERE